MSAAPPTRTPTETTASAPVAEGAAAGGAGAAAEVEAEAAVVVAEATAGGVTVTVGTARRTVTARAVRELATLGHLTPVPTAPRAVRGVTQLRGQVLPVVDLADPPRAPRAGDPLALVEVEGVRALLLVERDAGAAGIGARPEAAPPTVDLAAAFSALAAVAAP